MTASDGSRDPRSAPSTGSTDAARIVLRPVANPLPLGFFSFGVGMALLGGLGLGWLATVAEVRSAGVLMAAFVFPLELVAAVFAALSRDTAAATTLGLFATSWLGLGLLDVLDPAAQTDRAIGVFLVAFAIMLLPLMVTALAGKQLLGGMLALSIARAAFQAAHELGGPGWTDTADGITALVIVAGALYTGTAFLIEGVRGHTPLVPRRGPAAGALSHGVPDQFQRLPLDPGVRDQL